jgi:hypothetical protein
MSCVVQKVIWSFVECAVHRIIRNLLICDKHMLLLGASKLCCSQDILGASNVVLFTGYFRSFKRCAVHRIF